MGTDERSRKPIASTSNQGYPSVSMGADDPATRPHAMSYSDLDRSRTPQDYGPDSLDGVTPNMDAGLGARFPLSEGPVAQATSAGSAGYPLDPIAYPASRNYTALISTHSPAPGSRYLSDRSMPGLQGESSNMPSYSPDAHGDDEQQGVEVDQSRRPPFPLEHESEADKQTAFRRTDDVSPEYKRPRIDSNVMSTGMNRPARANSTQQPGQGPHDDYKKTLERRRRSSAGGSHGRGRKYR